MTDVVAVNRLREHEAAIERSLAELGWHLRAIRDGRLYLATHETFESYCRERWHYSRQHVNRQIAAADTIDAIESNSGPNTLEPNGSTPTEGQVRPLSALPIEERAEAWAEAVETYGDDPTAAEVAEVVQLRRPQSSDHPARFSGAIIAAVVELLEPCPPRRILDPFAGTGLVHAIADKLGADSVGVEIEPEWAGLHQRTVCADARSITREMVGMFDAVVTSPTYGNRMADHHEARDESDRATYRHRLGRRLADGNAGAMAWGDDYRALHVAVYRRVVRLLAVDGLLVLNVKDHVRDGDRVRVSGWHVRTLLSLGLTFCDDNALATRGLGGAGDNASSREGVEHVYLLAKEGT